MKFSATPALPNVVRAHQKVKEEKVPWWLTTVTRPPAPEHHPPVCCRGGSVAGKMDGLVNPNTLSGFDPD